MLCASTLMLIAFATSCARTDGQAQAVEKQLKDYQQALLDADAEQAWAIVDARTKEFYSQIARDAVSLRWSDLARLQFSEKYTVLRLRNEFRRGELLGLDGHAVFALGVTNGWISRSGAQNIGPVSKVVVVSERAFFIQMLQRVSKYKVDARIFDGPIE